MLGTAYGLCTCSFNLGLAITPLVVGYIKDHFHSYYWVEVLFTCMGVSAFGLALILWVVDVSVGNGLLSSGAAALANSESDVVGSSGGASGKGAGSDAVISVPGLVDDDYHDLPSQKPRSDGRTGSGVVDADQYDSLAADLRSNLMRGGAYSDAGGAGSAAAVYGHERMPVRGVDGIDVVADDLDASATIDSAHPPTSNQPRDRTASIDSGGD